MATTHDSSAPNTRPIISSGVSRCRIVSMLTSTRGLAKPRIATAATQAAALGETVTSSRGADQSTTPIVRSTPSRPRAAREIATIPPSTDPIPMIALR